MQQMPRVKRIEKISQAIVPSPFVFPPKCILFYAEHANAFHESIMQPSWSPQDRHPSYSHDTESLYVLDFEG